MRLEIRVGAVDDGGVVAEEKTTDGRDARGKQDEADGGVVWIVHVCYSFPLLAQAEGQPEAVGTAMHVCGSLNQNMFFRKRLGTLLPEFVRKAQANTAVLQRLANTL